MRSNPLIHDLEATLDQLVELLENLSDDQYQRRSAICFNGSIGMHVRHNLDHLAAFFSGLEHGFVDYEARGRDPGIASAPALAAEAARGHLARLQKLDGEALARPVEVREESEGNDDGARRLPSSAGRELQFLLGHTVHHNALIATIAADLGIPLQDGFGVAPATRRHQRREAASNA